MLYLWMLPAPMFPELLQTILCSNPVEHWQQCPWSAGSSGCIEAYAESWGLARR